MTDAAARRRAAAIAGHVGDVATVRALTADDDASVRATAIGALARLGELDAITLSTALRDADPVVRRRAVELGARRPDVDLIALLDDRDDSVVETAAWASGERGRASAEVVQRLVNLAGGHRDALVREAAVAALGALGDEAGLPAILAATEDKPAVRRRAVLALAPFQGPAVDAALQRALSDHDWQVRQAAEDLLS
ncbi:MAG: HEAT repeat domain-containing protein [Acidimicrobiales bacterium]